MADRSCEVCGNTLTRRQGKYCSRACYYASQRQPLEDRFWRIVGPLDTDGCREWLGSRDEHGRGKFHFGARNGTVKAHRMAYELAVGPVPPGLVVCHHCDRPACCEPTHLFLGTQADNVADMVQKGRHSQSQKTHCPLGHEYTPENTGRSGRGRRCRKCNIIKVRKYRKQKKESTYG